MRNKPRYIRCPTYYVFETNTRGHVPFTYAVRAVKLLKKKGCQTYLVDIVKAEKDELVKDYHDVYRKIIYGIPPDQSIEFIIDLVHELHQFRRLVMYDIE